MSARPPLPFGLGRDPICAPRRCLSPDAPLPLPGSPIHDQVAQSLSQLFQTFFATSLRYLGVSEVLDWVESSGTIDAWILTGIEQGRLPDEVGNKKNLEFGRETIKSVIKNALEAENEAWATSLRETGFSSSVSMVYEGIVAQLQPSKSAPLPCLHTLLTPTGLSMLKSAPLKSAFPICPPRTPPSPAPLLASIRNLRDSGILTGPEWGKTTHWRESIRKAFWAYHHLLREIAEELVSARSFAQEFYTFLESISQPIQLLQLIADDFENEFGVGATRGLLGVGDAGGDNLISIMDFCAAKKPSQLLLRVKQRVQEKQEREKRSKEVDAKRARLKELDTRIRVLLLEYRQKGASAALPPPSATLAEAAAAEQQHADDSTRLQHELEATLDERDAVKAEVEELQIREEEDELARLRERFEKEKALAAAGFTTPISEGTRIASAPSNSASAAPLITAAVESVREQEGFTVGSSRDLLRDFPPSDPFATNAPRAGSTAAAAQGSKKGKAKAAVQPAPRPTRRNIPPPATQRYKRLRDFSPLNPAPLTSSPSSSRASSPVRTSRKRAPPSNASSSASPSRTRRTDGARSGGSRLRPSSASPARSSDSPMPDGSGQAEGDDDYCEACESCPACAAELRRAEEMVKRTQRKRVERKKELRREIGFGASSPGGGGGGGEGRRETQRERALRREQEEIEKVMRGLPMTRAESREGAGREEEDSDGEGSLPELVEYPSAASRAVEAPTMKRESSSDSNGSMPELESTVRGRHAAAVEEVEEEVDDPPEIDLAPQYQQEQQPQRVQPLTDSTNNPPSTRAAAKKRRNKKKKAAASPAPPSTTATTRSNDPSPPPAVSSSTTLPPPLDSLHALHSSQAQGFTPLSRYSPPKCCPPDRCTGVGPNYTVWAELDSLLYETCLAGFKYELIGALPSALFLVRDTMAKNYLLAGGRMTTDAGDPKEMDTYLALAEQRGLWHSVNYPEIQAWGQRVLAISLQKLVDVLRATLGDICICKMSQHLEILREARHRLSSCEQLDRQIPIDLPEIDSQAFMRWSHTQLREHKLSGPEWQGLSRQYLVQDFLLSFSDAFDAAMDRLVLRDPLLLAEDISTLLEWQGGCNTFETALRLGAKEREGIVVEFGTGCELLDGTEEGPEERRPLQSWGRLLELSSQARANGTPFSRDLAEKEKQRGNEFFARGEYEKAIVSFTTASIIVGGSEPVFLSNAAAARMKLGTAVQYSEAISDCTLALFYDHRNIKALYRRGMALCLLGRWKEAFADLRYLERTAPDCQPAKEALAWANERYAALKASKAIK